jgi:hypothetical protein
MVSPRILVAIGLLLAEAAGGEIIDRVAITVGARVITESEVRQAVRLRQFLNGEPLDFRAYILRDAGERLVDQLLIRIENENSRYGVPSEEAVAAAQAQIIAGLFRGDRVAYETALKEYGIDERLLLDHLRWQLTVVRFVGVRFGAGLQITPEEVQAYFTAEIAPKLGPGVNASVEDFQNQIEETLRQQRANELADEWLRETRARTIIDFHPEVFQ